MKRSTRRPAAKATMTFAVVYEAMKYGNEALVAKWLDGGGLVDARSFQAVNANGDMIINTPLISACSFGHVPVVDLLLERGASIDFENNDGTTALMNAAGNGHLPIVDLLLEHGASVNLQANLGYTALIHAASEGYTAIVRRLLRAGAQISLRDRRGKTAQKWAEQQGRHECVLAIREHVEATVAAQIKKAAAEASAPREVEEAPRAAADSADEGSARERGFPEALNRALCNGDVAGVVAWLDGGGQVDHRTASPERYDITMLMCTSGNGNLPFVELLLERGASVDLQDSYGGTALMYAAFNGHPDVVCRLLRAGAQIGLRDRSGMTAQKWAEEQGHHECARILRKHEATMAAEKCEHEATAEAEKREREATMAAEKRARRKDKKRAAKAAAQSAQADKVDAAAAAAEAARLEHEETVRRHDEREASERAEAKAAEAAKRAQVAAQRQAKAQAPPKPLTPASQPTAPKAKVERGAKRTDAAELEHHVHVKPEQKTIRATAFVSRQVVVKEEADLKKARAQAKAVKEASVRASAEEAAARHVVPSAPTMSDMMAGKLT